MARIRSTHPTQWNDDDFLECSPLARLLAIAIRNFADDNGVFEWKPKQIKRNCLPADACDVVPLLVELERNKQVTRFTFDGKEYGAIRNFRPWQRPKTPKSLYPCPSAIRKYVGLDGPAISEKSEPDDDPISEIDTPSEVTQSENGRADVGGRRLEVREGGNSEPNGSGAVAPNGHDHETEKPRSSEPEDDRTWLFRDGLAWLSEITGKSANSQRALMGKWLKEAGDDASIVRKALEEAREKPVADPVSWMAKVLPVKVREAAANAPPDPNAGWRTMVKTYRDLKVWPIGVGPKPDQPGCDAPDEILTEFGFIPKVLRRDPPASAATH
jgi:hypothetical protein